MIDWYWWILVIALHELGHYVGFKIFGYKSKIVFINWGVAVYCKDGAKMLVWQSMLMYSLGIIFGLMVVLLLSGTLIDYFLYYIFCTIDIAFLHLIIMNKQFNKRICDVEDRIDVMPYAKKTK